MEKTIRSVTSLFTLTTACSIMKPPQTMPDATVPAVVQVIPSQIWTDTGLVVRKGDSLFFSATGEIHWSQRESTVSPDGIKGLPGWTVGPGGLVGRVAGTSKIFDIGARTQPFPVKKARVHLSYPPPPIAVPGEGTLLLGASSSSSPDRTPERSRSPSGVEGELELSITSTRQSSIY
jgi:hypothetical protein